jgi:uncharacterized protein
VKFEWDPAKEIINRKKHGIGFDEAATVFADAYARFVDDPDHSIHERRFSVLGMSDFERLLWVSYTYRPGTTRLIGARRATPAERRRYEEKKSR